VTASDVLHWRNELLQKIGGYGVSDLQLLEIAAAICSKESLTDEQRRYACEFEARLGGALTCSPLKVGSSTDANKGASGGFVLAPLEPMNAHRPAK